MGIHFVSPSSHHNAESSNFCWDWLDLLTLNLHKKVYPKIQILSLPERWVFRSKLGLFPPLADLLLMGINFSSSQCPIPEKPGINELPPGSTKSLSEPMNARELASFLQIEVMARPGRVLAASRTRLHWATRAPVNQGISLLNRSLRCSAIPRSSYKVGFKRTGVLQLSNCFKRILRANHLSYVECF